MLTLLLLRHAAARHQPADRDYERPLRPTGERAAAAIGRQIASLVGMPDAIVTSPAYRALETAQIVAGLFADAPAPICEEAIYEASTEELLDVVRALPDDAQTVLLVGHNPGLSLLAELLAQPGNTEVGLSTSGLAHFEFAEDHWSAVQPGEGLLRGLYTPEG